MKLQSLSGQTAIVTGGSRGIGKGIAKALASNGVHLHLIARNLEAVEFAAADLSKEYNIEAKGWSLDVSDGDAVQSTVKEISALSDRIEILVNNAGITKDNLLLRMKEEDFDSVINTNLKSVFLFSKALLRTMIKQKYGRVVNVSSVVGVRGQAGQANYAASKAGMVGFTKSFAKEVANRGITCNAIAPGFIASDMTDGLSEDQKSTILSQIPQAQFGKVEDIGNLVTFLASEESGYITGQTIGIDGGLGM